MKSHNFSTILFVLFLFISASSFSQNDCGNNADFEMGTTAGWVCKSGTYGSAVWSGICPAAGVGICPAFPTVLSTIGCLNTGGMNAPLNTFNDRHTIMSIAYTAGTYTAGYDSISRGTVPVVPPGGGTYSFRLGDAVPGGVGVNPNRLARAEAVRLTFNVNSSNAGFTYRYAVFLQDPGHLPEEQPRFEVFLTQPDSNDQLIPCGYRKYVAGSSNPNCSDTLTFKIGGNGGNSNWRYADWRDVGVDLSAFIGQNISVEFRTSDCFPQQSVVYSVAGATTTCTNGICTWSLPTPGITTISSCTNAPGTHSAYVYIDAFCTPSVSEQGCLTRIKELKDQTSFHIYPNPVNSSSVLELSSPVMNAELIVYDVLGKELFRKRFSGLKTEIKKEDLDAGVYFVKVEDGEKKMTGRIMVE